MLQLKTEAQFDRAPQSVTYDADNSIVTVHHRQTLKRFHQRGLRYALSPSAKFLILDASADEKIIEQFLPIERFEEISVRRNAHVIQCHSTSSPNSRLAPHENSNRQYVAEAQRHIDEVQATIENWCDRYGKVLVIGPSSVTGNPNQNKTGLLKPVAGAEFAHFNALRGVDAWKDCNAAIIIGRNQPPPNAIEDIGRALFYDHPERLNIPGDLITEARGYSLLDGEFGVEVQVHPDQRLQAILEQQRERESEQGLDRLRVIHHQGEPKPVLLFSNLVLDVEVHELRSWNEIVSGGSRLEHAFFRQADGVLPLRPEWLAANYPDLWPTAEAARKDVGRKTGQSSNINIIRRMSAFDYQYKPASQRRWSRCLSRFADAETTAQKLTIALGEVISIKPMLQSGRPQ